MKNLATMFSVLLLLVFAVSCSNSTTRTGTVDDDPMDNERNDNEQSDAENDDSASGSDDDGDDSASGGENNGTTPGNNNKIVENLEFESGFFFVEGVEYSLKSRSDKTGKAMIWYNFQPADENPEEKPLFVFYNGGPGSASAIVFLYNTAKRTGDQAFSEDGFAENGSSWTQLGNLLYVDARQTGFSYGIIDDPEDRNERRTYFSTSNFNVFADAADFIRVILRFLKTHPALESNPVILAGESYGGTRSTAILNILLNVADYAENNRVFYDETLFEEIAAHFKRIDSNVSGMPSKEDVAKQFGRQIMIQPLIAGNEQFEAEGELLERDDSPLYVVQDETGVKFNKCSGFNCNKHNNALIYIQRAGRDIYSYRRPYNWLFDYTDVATAKMLHMPMFEEFILNDPRKIDELYAENRTGVFRYADVPNLCSRNLTDAAFADLPEIERIVLKNRIVQRNLKPLSTGNLESVFGDLQAYDEYFVDLNYDINSAFYSGAVSHYDTVNGEMFLENIKSVKTFITQAEEDIIIYAKGIPESLKSFNGVSGVTVKDDSFTVNFSDGQNVEVTFPFYPESSHSVSVNQPAKFFNDVRNWL
ncbi:hypothetical protein J6Z19_08675 [bacterium]|nr:hypothetical protein [bacterium]